MKITNMKSIGAVALAGALASPAFEDGSHAYPGTHRLARFTPGDYPSEQSVPAPAATLTRAEVPAEIRADLAKARAAHEIDIDRYG